MKENVKTVDRLNDLLCEHMKILERCTVECETGGPLLLASPPKTRYPYFYPRDGASASALLRRVATSEHDYDCRDEAYRLLRSMARFVRDVETAEGFWGQRYQLDGTDKSIYKQEDNTSHGLAILCNFLLAAHQREDVPDEIEKYLQAVAKGAEASCRKLYIPELNLFYSTTAIHESELEQGYTCWNNFSYLYAFSLVHEIAGIYDGEDFIDPSLLDFRQQFLYSVSELFIQSGRYKRRIDTHGHPDTRPDVTLLSPFYFGFVHYSEELKRSVAFLEKHLWDPEMGMVMRYLPFQKDFAVHVHAGHGPWLQYTAMLAQYHYWKGNRDRGDDLLERINRFRNERGEIPEHVSTCHRFERFMEKEWKTGIDFAKEFHESILLEGCNFDKILEEANNMSCSYKETERHCMVRDPKEVGGGFIQFAAPLAWSHVEYMRACMVRAGDWWLKKPVKGSPHS